MTTRPAIDELASDIAQKAMEEDTKLEQKIEALKALNGYLAILQKGGKKSDDEDRDGPDFYRFRADINEAENGRRTKPRIQPGGRTRSDDN